MSQSHIEHLNTPANATKPTRVENAFEELLVLFKKVVFLTEIERKIIIKNYAFKNITCLFIDDLAKLALLTSSKDDVSNNVTGLWLLSYMSYYSEFDLLDVAHRIPFRRDDWSDLTRFFNIVPKHPLLQKTDIFYFACLLAIYNREHLLRLVLSLPQETFNNLNLKQLLDDGRDALISKISIHTFYSHKIFLQLLLKLPDAIFDHLKFDSLFPWLFESAFYKTTHSGFETVSKCPRKLLSRIFALPENVTGTIHFIHPKPSSHATPDEITIYDTNFRAIKTLITHLNWAYNWFESDAFLSFYFKLSAEQLKQWQFYFKTLSDVSVRVLGEETLKLLALHSFRWDVLKSTKSDKHFDRLLTRAKKMGEPSVVNYCIYDLARSWPMSEISCIAYSHVLNCQPLLYTNSRYALAQYYFNKESNNSARRTSHLLTALEYSLQAFSIRPEADYETLARRIIQTLFDINSGCVTDLITDDSTAVDWFESTIQLLKLSGNEVGTLESVINDCLIRANNQFVVDKLEQLEVTNQEYKNEITEINQCLDRQQQQIIFLLTTLNSTADSTIKSPSYGS